VQDCVGNSFAVPVVTSGLMATFHCLTATWGYRVPYTCKSWPRPSGMHNSTSVRRSRIVCMDSKRRQRTASRGAWAKRPSSKEQT
jgi:hypothetical protein